MSGGSDCEVPADAPRKILKGRRQLKKEAESSDDSDDTETLPCDRWHNPSAGFEKNCVDTIKSVIQYVKYYGDVPHKFPNFFNRAFICQMVCADDLEYDDFEKLVNEIGVAFMFWLLEKNQILDGTGGNWCVGFLGSVWADIALLPYLPFKNGKRSWYGCRVSFNPNPHRRSYFVVTINEVLPDRNDERPDRRTSACFPAYGQRVDWHESYMNNPN
jgi:hypothetical protein